MLFVRLSLLLGISALVPLSGFTQLSPAKPTGPRVEPGLEKAVGWKWQVVPSDERTWGFALPEPTPPPPSFSTSIDATPTPEPLSRVYEVKKGDALILIAKRHGITVAQLKGYNEMTSDVIRVGQTLKIPTSEQAEAIVPTPVREKPDKPKANEPSKAQDIALQVFLDREQFSSGPISDQPSLTFQKVLQRYQSTHPDAMDIGALAAKAQAAVGDGYTTYTLKDGDFRFIAPPKAQRYDPTAPVAKETASPSKSKGQKAAVHIPSITYQELTEPSMLAYRTPWEFVAEKFHCNETFLRSINGSIKNAPMAGTTFRVPNVIPFEIENALKEPVQSKSNPQDLVKAEVVDLSLIEIFHGDKLVAVMPISVARPGLRGRGTWTILNAIPRPRLATLQEPRDRPQMAPPPFGSSSNEPTPTPPPAKLSSEEYLAAGPNNPVGIIWINLAKADSTEILPYGLSGTSIPDQMETQESIGGFRLTNWDIARAVRLLPEGTQLEWKQSTPAVMPVARPAFPTN